MDTLIHGIVVMLTTKIDSALIYKNEHGVIMLIYITSAKKELLIGNLGEQIMKKIY